MEEKRGGEGVERRGVEGTVMSDGRGGEGARGKREEGRGGAERLIVLNIGCFLF